MERSTTQSHRNASDDRVWSKAIMFLDGASYIIAFYLIDTFTFGPSQFRVVSPSVREEFVLGTSPGSPTRRFASESELATTPVHRHHQAREKNFSETQVVDARHQEVSTSPCCNEKNHRHKDDYFANRSLHHYQKKLFSRQVERTVQLQPYIKLTLLLSFCSIIFLVYVRIFGVPLIFGIVALHLSHILGPIAYFIRTLSSTLYEQVHLRMPLPRSSQTGYEVVLTHLRALWTTLFAWLGVLSAR